MTTPLAPAIATTLGETCVTVLRMRCSKVFRSAIVLGGRLESASTWPVALLGGGSRATSDPAAASSTPQTIRPPSAGSRPGRQEFVASFAVLPLGIGCVIKTISVPSFHILP